MELQSVVSLASSLSISIHGPGSESSKWVREVIRILTGRSNGYEGTHDYPITPLHRLDAESKAATLKPNKPEMSLHTYKNKTEHKTSRSPNRARDLNESKCLHSS